MLRLMPINWLITFCHVFVPADLAKLSSSVCADIATQHEHCPFVRDFRSFASMITFAYIIVPFMCAACTGSRCKTCVRGLLTDKSSQNECLAMRCVYWSLHSPPSPKVQCWNARGTGRWGCAKGRNFANSTHGTSSQHWVYGGGGDWCCCFAHRLLSPRKTCSVNCIANFCPSTVGNGIRKFVSAFFYTIKLEKGLRSEDMCPGSFMLLRCHCEWML